MPFHRWLPAAMVAPTPVSALLHAVAVVKAGVFTVLKVVVYVFGLDLLARTGAQPLARLCRRGDDPDRLAGRADQGQPQGAARLLDRQPALLHRARRDAGDHRRRDRRRHAHRHARLRQDHAVLLRRRDPGREPQDRGQRDAAGSGGACRSPSRAFFLGSLSIIGLPPMGGSWSKWYLVLGAARRGPAGAGRGADDLARCSTSPICCPSRRAPSSAAARRASTREAAGRSGRRRCCAWCRSASPRSVASCCFSLPTGCTPSCSRSEGVRLMSE